jgi:hypothetical protein
MPASHRRDERRVHMVDAISHVAGEVRIVNAAARGGRSLPLIGV